MDDKKKAALIASAQAVRDTRDRWRAVENERIELEKQLNHVKNREGEAKNAHQAAKLALEQMVLS